MASGYGQYDLYGATPPIYGGDAQFQPYDGPMKSPFARGRKSANFTTMAMVLFLPFLVFLAVYALLTFSIHYQIPSLSYVFCALLLIVVLVFGYLAYSTMMKHTEETPEAAWALLLFATGLFAWLVGLVCGLLNYNMNMVPYFDITNLNVYPAVDPAVNRGQQLMDAGRVIFTPGSHLDITKSMGFRNLNMYCVAPVASSKGRSNRTFDFWAVGLNCCSGHAPDFHCGEYNNPLAFSGLRLMRKEQRAFFRLAVQQAEAAYNIHAPHPMFFYWMQDPIAEVNAYQDSGYKAFVIGIIAFFAFQLFVVIAASMAISKMYS